MASDAAPVSSNGYPAVMAQNAAGDVKAVGPGTPMPSSLPITPVGAHTQVTPVPVATVAVAAGATAIMMQVQAQNVRYRLDGVNPTATLGFQLKAGDPPVVVPVTGADIRFIQEVAGAILDYQWVK